MNARILRPEEWGRLPNGEKPGLLPPADPSGLAVVAVETVAGDIAACVSVFQATHFEGLWVDPKFRGNAGVWRPLIRHAFAIPRVRGERWVFGAAAHGDERMPRVLTQLGGAQMQMDLYVLPTGVIDAVPGTSAGACDDRRESRHAGKGV